MNAIGEMRRSIAVVAKYPFYFDDIIAELRGSNIEIITANEIGEIQEKINSGINFDTIFFPHYSKMVPSQFLKQQNCIGFHTGDLPSDRGGSPIQHKILRGEYSTFVSAIKLIEEVDAGDILCQESISLEHGSIESILRDISKIIARFIKLILVDSPIPTPQRGASRNSPRLKPQASELNLDNLELRQIYDRIRMLDGLDYPSAYLQFSRFRLILSHAHLENNQLTFVSKLEENM
jgi:methionyl-tRNA formyltransferase